LKIGDYLVKDKAENAFTNMSPMGGQRFATHKIDAKIVQAECKCKKKTKFLFLALPKRSLSKA